MTERASSGVPLQYQAYPRDPPVGGPHKPAGRTAAWETDGWDPRPARLPLYPWGVGLYKPPRAPIQRVDLIEFHTHLERKGELALPFLFL